jgi:hypothetical protein
MIDDSDVFSIIVSSANPSEVFASACSGIYKSVSGGDQFEKIKGIPFTARRTRVLKQDPSNPAIVYAGTTEGLWKSVDEGKNWKRVSGPEVVVNDVLIDPRNSQRVLLATDRSGVLASDDAAATFTPSNHGYSHRYVSAILADSKEPNTLYIGLVNDREFGGVFFTHDGGQTWQQKSSGLDGRDVFTLKQASNGTLVAGTNRGVFELTEGGSTWHPNQQGCGCEDGLAHGYPEERQEKDCELHRQHTFCSGRPRQRYRSRANPLVRSNFFRTLHQQRSRQNMGRGPGCRGEGLRFRAVAGRSRGGGNSLGSPGFRGFGSGVAVRAVGFLSD